MKSKPHTIRFDENDYDFICKRENLKTAQSILDFLMSEYMKIYKIEKPSIFIPANKESFDGKKNKRLSIDEVGQFEESRKIKITDANKQTQEVKSITKEKPKTNFTINTNEAEKMPDGLNWKEQLEWNRNH